MGKFLMRMGNRLHAWLVKKTGKFGGGTEEGSVLVLDHVGAKSGTLRESPLMFMRHDDAYVVCGSMMGAPRHPAWYHNLKANPDTTISVAKETIPVRARELSGEERDAVWRRFLDQDKRWGEYAAKTDRVLPLIALEPR